MRLHVKLLVSIVVASTVLLSASYWSTCNNIHKHERPLQGPVGIPTGHLTEGPSQPSWAHNHLNQLPEHRGEPVKYEEIDCLINGEYSVTGRREQNEVYLPFYGFVSKYFEVTGHIQEYDGYERFEFEHSYSKVYPPQGKYTPDGVFMSFEHYNVEVRNRVKCISGIEGVPISTQWGAQGYFYPIQIAQYGLSHYSKFLVDRTPAVHMKEDAEDSEISRWIVDDKAASVDNVIDRETRSRVIEFDTSETEELVTLWLDAKAEQTLSFDIRFVTNGSVTVVFEVKGSREPYYVHYVCSRTLIDVQGKHIYYGIGDRTRWSRVTRDLAIDLQKGIVAKTKKKKSKGALVRRIARLVVHGRGYIDNITLSTSAHLAMFYYAANWLVLHQDSKGGWPIMVTRKLANGMLELPPGWYSGMAQGQAMSLLTRAYLRTRNRKYLEAALRATHLFDIPSSRGGVRTRFLDRYDWYEEYPTTPSSFVLNGFIYSLIGLYDLSVVAPSSDRKEAERLYNTGMDSLKAMLPLFDTGSGSIYDLRHFTLGVAPNLARWDYHTTHINQLLLLATVDSSSILDDTAQRWTGYMKGKRAPHN